MATRLNNAEFIRRAKQLHRDKYDYSVTDFVNHKIKVTIICPEHGAFDQRPTNHLSGHGCGTCARIEAAKGNTIPESEFLHRAREIHGNTYNYSQADYLTTQSKIKIICPDHGAFFQTPAKHLSGHNCPKCAGNIRLSTEEFVSRANEVHKHSYDYSTVRYKNNSTKVTIICREHGEFNQTPARHLAGMGCIKCGRLKTGEKKALSQEEFVEKARDIHGDRYNYDKAKYTRSNRKVTILCPEHGEFEKTPNKHLSGEGCSKCSKRYRRTAEDFVADARKIHGDKYDYSKSDYSNTKNKVTIICLRHGLFQQTPEMHLSGQECPSCSKVKQLSTDEFIRRAETVHGTEYDYSKVNYVNSTNKLIIICKKHGEFQQYQYNHLKGTGCPKCSGNRRLSNNEFIEQSRAVHGYKYSYSHSKYIRSSEKVEIICPVHGIFLQAPNAHLTGVGCPSCAHYGINPHEPGILYYIKVETRTHTFWKIGITNRTVEKRFLGSDLKKITPIKTWPYKKLGDALLREQEILEQHVDSLYTGPELPLASGGNTELFTLDVLRLGSSL